MTTPIKFTIPVPNLERELWLCENTHDAIIPVPDRPVTVDDLMSILLQNNILRQKITDKLLDNSITKQMQLNECVRDLLHRIDGHWDCLDTYLGAEMRRSVGPLRAALAAVSLESPL